MQNESQRKLYTAVVFIVSLLIFVSSLVPGAFFVSSTVDLSGAAGGPIVQPTQSSNPTEPPTNTPSDFSAFDSGLSIASGVVSILSAVYGIQLTRSEFAKLKTSQIDKEMQRQEIEKLRIELELEKLKTEKKKSKASLQRQEGKTKTKPKQDTASKLKIKKARS